MAFFVLVLKASILMVGSGTFSYCVAKAATNSSKINHFAYA